MGGISIEGPKILFQLPFFGGLNITETVVTSWLIILAVFILCKFLTHNLEKIPTKKRQQLAEKAVIMIDKLVADTMGERNMAYAPYIMTLMVFSLLGSLVSLLVRGSPEETMDCLEGLHPLFAEALPLTLEEAFFSEMEVLGYDSDSQLSR